MLLIKSTLATKYGITCSLGTGINQRENMPMKLLNETMGSPKRILHNYLNQYRLTSISSNLCSISQYFTVLKSSLIAINGPRPYLPTCIPRGADRSVRLKYTEFGSPGM